MHRVLVPPSAIHADEVVVSDRKAVHHLVRVARLRVGERIECFDGRGRVWAGLVRRCAPQEVVVAVETQRREAPTPRIVLAMSLIKPDRFDWVVEKATELGVAAIRPVLAARSGTAWAAGQGTARHSRWERLAQAAACQCGRATVPTIDAPLPLAEAVQRLGAAHKVVLTLPAEGTGEAWKPRLVRAAPEVALFIGPEGDFTPEETRAARQAGAHLARLEGPILRADTAALAAVVLARQALGWW